MLYLIDAKHWGKAYSNADTTMLGWYQEEHAVSKVG